MKRHALLALLAAAMLSLGGAFATTYDPTRTLKVFDTDGSGGYFYNGGATSNVGPRPTTEEMAQVFGSTTWAGHFIGFMPYKSYSVGSPINTGLGTVFNALEARFPFPRVCIDHRPDLQRLYDDSIADTYTVGTTAARYCAAGTPNNCTTWEGYMTTCQGGSNAGTRCVVGDSTCTGGGTCGAADEVFNTDWIMRVPIAEHNALVTDRWGGDDWFDIGTTSHDWSDLLDDDTIAGLVTASTVPALYAETRDAPNDETMFIGSVVIDLRYPAARLWKVKQLMETLEDYGVDSDDDICVFWSYKPGFYNYEPDAGANFDSCRESGDRAYAGHLWPEGILPAGCNSNIGSSRPVYDTQYALGQYEAAVDAYYSELLSALDSAGFEGVTLIVQRAPAGYSTTIEDEIPSLLHSRRYRGEIEVITSDPYP